MPPREILRYPHPALKARCAPAAPGVALERVARDLVDTMRSFPRCVGLAAPQIGELVRVVAVDVTGHPKARTTHGLIVVANPVVVDVAGDELGREGCLSIPDLTADVRRATHIRVEGVSATGEATALESDAFEARALLHEIDHLDGILFLDRVASRDALFRRKRYA